MRTDRSVVKTRIVRALPLALCFACGSDAPTGLTLADVAGAYAASTLEREVAEGVIDELARGASLTMNLSSDGSTTGQLFVPAENDSTADFVADLAGTWTLNGPVVRFMHPSNTFLVDIGFLYSNGQLAGQRSTGSETISVVLTR